MLGSQAGGNANDRAASGCRSCPNTTTSSAPTSTSATYLTSMNQYSYYPSVYGQSMYGQYQVVQPATTTAGSTTTTSNPYAMAYGSHYGQSSYPPYTFPYGSDSSSTKTSATVGSAPVAPTTDPYRYSQILTHQYAGASQTISTVPTATVAHPPPLPVIDRKHHSDSKHSANARKPFKKFKHDPKNTPVVKEYYCDTCQITCIGQSSLYKHMLGNKHKKRQDYLDKNKDKEGRSDLKSPLSTETMESNIRFGDQSDSSGNKKCISLMSVMLRCRVCNVSCVSVDSYSSHIRGQKHSRTVSLKKKFGELVPSNVPEILSQNIPKSLEAKIHELFSEKNADGAANYSTPSTSTAQPQSSVWVEKTIIHPNEDEDENEDDESLKSVKPIGQDFIEEVLNQNGKLVCFTCTLCECRFNDVNAKNLHLKGRRHRLQYKKKVDPTLIVEFVKSDKKKIEREKKLKQQKLNVNASFHTDKQLIQDLNPFESGEHSRLFSTVFSYNRNNTYIQGWDFFRSFSDYLLEHKHKQISPDKMELEYIYQTAYLLEKAIRSVGKFIELNFLVPVQSPKFPFLRKRLLDYQQIETLMKNNQQNLVKSESMIVDFIRVIRPGPLGKGTMLGGEDDFEMVILSSILPTVTLLRLFEELLPSMIKKLASDKTQYPEQYQVTSELDVQNAMFRLKINSMKGKVLNFKVCLTSPNIRQACEEQLKHEVHDLLDLSKCQHWLAEIRHFRWFREKAVNYSFFGFVIRILRDLARRIEIWSRLTLYSMEVVLERVVASANCFLAPSSLFRHFFEFLSHGVIMEQGSGLADPCETALVNIFANLNMQDLNDVMHTAQHTIRLIAMRQLNKVLNIDDKEVYRVRMAEIGQQQQHQQSHHDDPRSSFQPYRGYKRKFDSTDDYDPAKNNAASDSGGEDDLDHDRGSSGGGSHRNNDPSGSWPKPSMEWVNEHLDFIAKNQEP